MGREKRTEHDGKTGRKRWKSKYITNDDSDDDEAAINNGKLGVKLHRKNNVRGSGGWLFGRM